MLSLLLRPIMMPIEKDITSTIPRWCKWDIKMFLFCYWKFILTASFSGIYLQVSLTILKSIPRYMLALQRRESLVPQTNINFSFMNLWRGYPVTDHDQRQQKCILGIKQSPLRWHCWLKWSENARTDGGQNDIHSHGRHFTHYQVRLLGPLSTELDLC